MYESGNMRLHALPEPFFLNPMSWPFIAFYGGLDTRQHLPSPTVLHVVHDDQGWMTIGLDLTYERLGSLRSDIRIDPRDSTFTYDDEMFRTIALYGKRGHVRQNIFNIFGATIFFAPLLVATYLFNRLRPRRGEQGIYGPFGSALRRSIMGQLNQTDQDRFDRALENTWRRDHRV